MHAATAGLPIPRMALLEPPIELNEDRSAQRLFTTELSNLLAAGQPERATEFYLTGIGVPEEIVASMRGSVSWSATESVAPHLRLRQSDQRGDLIRSTGFGDSADPCARQRGKQRRSHRHGRHGGRRAAQGACMHQRGPLRRGAGPARRMPGWALRRLSLHLPARAGWPPRTRGRPPRMTRTAVFNLPLLRDPPRPVVRP